MNYLLLAGSNLLMEYLNLIYDYMKLKRFIIHQCSTLSPATWPFHFNPFHNFVLNHSTMPLPLNLFQLFAILFFFWSFISVSKSKATSATMSSLARIPSFAWRLRDFTSKVVYWTTLVQRRLCAGNTSHTWEVVQLTPHEQVDDADVLNSAAQLESVCLCAVNLIRQGRY